MYTSIKEEIMSFVFLFWTKFWLPCCFDFHSFYLFTAKNDHISLTRFCFLPKIFDMSNIPRSLEK